MKCTYNYNRYIQHYGFFSYVYTSSTSTQMLWVIEDEFFCASNVGVIVL